MAQPAVVAIDLIGCHPVTGRTSLQRTLNHASRQLGLGGKLGLFWNGRDAATLVIGGPFFTKIQLTIHQRRALGTGVAEKLANLAVLNASRRADVLALDPD